MEYGFKTNLLFAVVSKTIIYKWTESVVLYMLVSGIFYKQANLQKY